MVLKFCQSVLSDLDTKQRIMEVSIHLFATKGVDGTSIREIAKMANVNVASLNYHFKSKENLRLEAMEYIVNDFKKKIESITDADNAAAYAVKFFEAMTIDSAKCLNQFKLILEAETHPCATDPYPVGHKEFSVYLTKELNKSVPESERLWMTHAVFSYIIHTAVMSSTNFGKTFIEKNFPKKRASIPIYVSQLVKSLIRDLNNQYP